MPDPTLAEARMDRIRARAAAHHEEIESVTWPTAAVLAARWGLGVQTVYEIPRDRLPYKEFGKGPRPRRRYRPADVAAFEAEDEKYAPTSDAARSA